MMMVIFINALCYLFARLKKWVLIQGRSRWDWVLDTELIPCLFSQALPFCTYVRHQFRYFFLGVLLSAQWTVVEQLFSHSKVWYVEEFFQKQLWSIHLSLAQSIGVYRHIWCTWILHGRWASKLRLSCLPASFTHCTISPASNPLLSTL